MKETQGRYLAKYFHKIQQWMVETMEFIVDEKKWRSNCLDSCEFHTSIGATLTSVVVRQFLLNTILYFPMYLRGLSLLAFNRITCLSCVRGHGIVDLYCNLTMIVEICI